MDMQIAGALAKIENWLRLIFVIWNHTSLIANDGCLLQALKLFSGQIWSLFYIISTN